MADIVITLVDGTPTITKISDPTFGRMFKGGVDIQIQGGYTTIIGQSGGLSFKKSEVDNIDGTPPDDDDAVYRGQLNAVFPRASFGGALNFTEITDGIYTGGDQFVTISGSSPSTIDVDATSGGRLHVFNTGSATTLNLGEKSYTINATGGASGGLSSFWINIVDGKYLAGVDLSGKYWDIPLPIPDAPTAPLTDDDLDLYNWTNPAGVTSVSQLEYTLNAGSSYADLTAKPLVVGDVTKVAGQVGVRVKAVPLVSQASATLYNGVDFNSSSVILLAGINSGSDTPITAGTNGYENSSGWIMDDNIFTASGTIRRMSMWTGDAYTTLASPLLVIKIWRDADAPSDLKKTWVFTGPTGFTANGRSDFNVSGDSHAVLAGDRYSVEFITPTDGSKILSRYDSGADHLCAGGITTSGQLTHISQYTVPIATIQFKVEFAT